MTVCLFLDYMIISYFKSGILWVYTYCMIREGVCLDTLSECHANKAVEAGVQTSYVHSSINIVLLIALLINESAT